VLLNAAISPADAAQRVDASRDTPVPNAPLLRAALKG
jgi:hypothetical protein